MKILKSSSTKIPNPRKSRSLVLTEEFWRNWRLEFIAAHNEKIKRKNQKV